MAKATTLFVGLDVHKDFISVAHAEAQCTEAPVFVGAIGSRQADIDTLVRRLRNKSTHLVFAYEAGPCGYVLHRYLTTKRRTPARRTVPTARAPTRPSRQMSRENLPLDTASSIGGQAPWLCKTSC